MSHENYVIPRKELEELRNISLRDDWPGVFSCNSEFEVWPSPGYGLTYEPERLHLQGKLKLNQLVTCLLEERLAGGRFFVDESGAWTDDGRGKEKFVQFQVM